MVSIVGPQHARIYYACMSGRQLIIRQSRLYSFMEEVMAPLHLFACMLLSHPLTEP